MKAFKEMLQEAEDSVVVFMSFIFHGQTRARNSARSFFSCLSGYDDTRTPVQAVSCRF